MSATRRLTASVTHTLRPTADSSTTIRFGKPTELNTNAVNKTCCPVSLRNIRIIELRSPWSVLPPKQRTFCPPARVKTSTEILRASDRERPHRTERDGHFNILSSIFSSRNNLLHEFRLYTDETKLNIGRKVIGLRVCPYVGERKLQPHPRIMLPQ